MSQRIILKICTFFLSMMLCMIPFSLDAKKNNVSYQQMHDVIIYPIEDIASYHIHAGYYYRKERPSGAHSNYGGNQLNYFNPQIQSHGPLGSKDVTFYNSRNINLTKPSSLYPENWSELICDLKAIEMMMTNNVDIVNDTPGILKIIGKTTEGLNIIVYYDIAQKRIKSHYPDSEKF